MEFSHEQGQKGLSNHPVDCMEVLAGSWLGELPIHASAIPCFIPQFCCFMLGNISESQGTVRYSKEGLVAGRKKRAPIAVAISNYIRFGFELGD